MDNKPVLKFTVDLNQANPFFKETRLTVTGQEKTLFVLVPSKGCKYGCDFCSVRHTANPDFPVSGKNGQLAAHKIADEVDAILAANPNTDSLKLFNNGNILYGQERKSSAEMHESFWQALLSVLKKHQRLKAVELEIRVDELVGSSGNGWVFGKVTPKIILRARMLGINDALKEMGKELRLILPFEYIESRIIAQQSKFPAVFANGGEIRGNCEKAIGWVKDYHLPWLAYAMLGGRLKDRPLTPEEAVSSTAHTVLFGIGHGVREAIINSQYLDPINVWEQQRTGVNYYMPTEKDMAEVLRLVVPWLKDLPKVCGSTPRVRLTTDKEDLIVGTIGPDITDEFRQIVSAFNNAPDQQEYFQRVIASWR